MTFNELLADFGNRIGNGLVLEPDESGTVNLSVDELSVMMIGIEETGMVAISGVVGEVPPVDHQERLFKALLMANHNFTGTNGATFSIDPDSREVHLERVMSMAEMNGEKFFDAVEHFINVLETWHKIVVDFRGSESPSENPKEEESASDFVRPSDFMRV